MKASDFIWSFIKPCATSFCFSLLNIVYFHIQTDYYHMFMNDGTYFHFMFVLHVLVSLSDDL